MIRDEPDGVRVQVLVRPRSRPDWNVAGGQLVITVAAPPVGGAANEEARRALAKALGVSPRRVSLRRGQRSRTKVFSVTGMDRDEALAALNTAP